MKIIIAPAKKMERDLDSFPIQTMPQFLDKTEVLAEFLKSRNDAQLKELWQASDRVIQSSKKQLEEMDLTHRLTPAIIAFSGIQYQYMAPDLFTQPALNYIQKNLRIISGFYGSLRPFDGVCPYRLEMKTQMVGFKDYSLYNFWNSKIADEIFRDDDLVINLASKEYSRVITPYLSENRRMITIDFQEEKNGKWRTIATHAKMARGEMVRFLAENQIKTPARLQEFHDFDFKFIPEESNENNYIFRTNFDFKRR
ncbi:peroxide stress protein YaaA [Lactobacillus hamsteri]|uniref:UPF0246 protein FC39_GL000883 n=1 Tax=Lactobacillus hamsteri DSM 5661 = JCM 6256 TaxID=1423754 RepID=A0A0R1YCK1_9LACO|nr:peroxide stress protein YaaA [Lactobacillus hamsteri]KRM40066.1 hypothetical protein FC39_GL000883 [Lactobacillus hamsteri DSM 5661 = JCM 6256]